MRIAHNYKDFKYNLSTIYYLFNFPLIQEKVS